MVADHSITDSQLIHGSPISRDVFTKRKETMLRELKQFKVDDDARHTQWTHQRKRGNANGDDDETGLSAASGSPTSVSDDDCLCCSKQFTEEDHEEAFVDANDEDSSDDDDYSDAFSMFKEEEEASPDQKKDDDDECCPLCAEKMDATDLSFKPCSSCEFKMCLFCYKRINEVGNGVCPGCRKKYEKQQNSGEVSFQQQRSGGEPLPLSSPFQVLGSDSD